ncbi:MAG: hypothetical protein WCQ16_03935 [Verrucomicrobiae bacterium]
MRFLVTCLTALAFAASVHAQTQERKLLDRVLKPDMGQGNSMQGKTFGKTGSVVLRQASESKDGFPGVRDAYIKDYPFQRSFWGIKNPWFGNKVYDTQAASMWSKSVIANADRAVPVKKAEAVGYYDATKQANFGSPVVPLRPFIPQPGAPGAVGRLTTEKINDKMTIDEVRELLNKPR